MSLDKTKTEYTFEDTIGKTDKEVTEMLKHNKRLRGWDGVEVVEPPALKVSNCCQAEITFNNTCSECHFPIN